MEEMLLMPMVHMFTKIVLLKGVESNSDPEEPVENDPQEPQAQP